ncbi:hypothetical protein HAX54_042358, partial [Datura stramonium]|nr:hypothetical protein [Datura stramonium]
FLVLSVVAFEIIMANSNTKSLMCLEYRVFELSVTSEGEVQRLRTISRRRRRSIESLNY